MKGLALEESGNSSEAYKTFLQAWNQSNYPYEKFISAFHLGLRQEKVEDQLQWLKKSLSFAREIDDENVKSAYPTLYTAIAKCYEEKENTEKANKYYGLAQSYQGNPTDTGPFYHGTKADLKVGEYLKSGQKSNYDENFEMNHIYFTANMNGAVLAAALARGEGIEHVYLVEPTGDFEHDPNVTDKKLPGNLTRSYRSTEPLKILRDVINWEKLSEDERQDWNRRLAKIKGEIIN